MVPATKINYLFLDIVATELTVSESLMSPKFFFYRLLSVLQISNLISPLVLIIQELPHPSIATAST